MVIMQDTCLNLCENIQGCVGGYVQSDEISLLLIDYQNLDSDAWFNYNLQKITSIAAARATLIFNYLVDQLWMNYSDEYSETGNSKAQTKYFLWGQKLDKAMFDARAFNIPKEEVCNYFIWRQKDATRNSIQAVGQAYFSHKELENKSQSDIQDMLHEKGINWNDYSITEKRGAFVRRGVKNIETEDGSVIVHYPWYVDYTMPILTENRDYIDKLVFVGE